MIIRMLKVIGNEIVETTMLVGNELDRLLGKSLRTCGVLHYLACPKCRTLAVHQVQFMCEDGHLTCPECKGNYPEDRCAYKHGDGKMCDKNLDGGNPLPTFHRALLKFLMPSEPVKAEEDEDEDKEPTPASGSKAPSPPPPEQSKVAVKEEDDEPTRIFIQPPPPLATEKGEKPPPNPKPRKKTPSPPSPAPKAPTRMTMLKSLPEKVRKELTLKAKMLFPNDTASQLACLKDLIRQAYLENEEGRTNNPKNN